MRLSLIVLGCLLLIATALPFVRSDAWWIRVFDFPRLQIALAILVVTAGFLFHYRPSSILDSVFLTLLLAAAAYQGYRILPYTSLFGPQVASESACPDGAQIRLLTANVLMDNRTAGKLLTLVEETEPDLVLAVETDAWWDGQLSALDSTFPFSVKHPLGNTYGMHLFSRLPLKDPQLRFLVEEDIPSIRTEVQLPSGAWITYYGVHPRPPRPQQDTAPRDAEILIVGKEAKEAGRPAIIAGDLNDVAWSRSTRLFQKVSGYLDPRIGRGLYATFHAKIPFFRWPLDHVFFEPSFTVIRLERLGYFGSDHFPILVELCYRPPAKRYQETPPSDAEDEVEAQEAIEEGLEKGLKRD